MAVVFNVAYAHILLYLPQDKTESKYALITTNSQSAACGLIAASRKL